MKKKSHVLCTVKAARWASYAVAGAATAMAANNDAEGAILYSGPINFDMTPAGSVVTTFAFHTLAANSVQGTAKLGRFSHFPRQYSHSSAGFYMLKGGNGSAPKVVNGHFRGRLFAKSHYSVGYASKLALGANIAVGPFVTKLAYGGYMAKYPSRSNSQFGNQENGDFLGFEFNLGGGEQYGWARVNMTSGQPHNDFTVVDYAYGTVGQAITAGETAVPTPEPASLGLLAIGAAGLLAFRKGKRQKKAETSAATL